MQFIISWQFFKMSNVILQHLGTKKCPNWLSLEVIGGKLSFNWWVISGHWGSFGGHFGVILGFLKNLTFYFRNKFDDLICHSVLCIILWSFLLIYPFKFCQSIGDAWMDCPTTVTNCNIIICYSPTLIIIMISCIYGQIFGLSWWHNIRHHHMSIVLRYSRSHKQILLIKITTHLYYTISKAFFLFGSVKC